MAVSAEVGKTLSAAGSRLVTLAFGRVQGKTGLPTVAFRSPRKIEFRFCDVGICRLDRMRPVPPGDIQVLFAHSYGTVHVGHNARMAEKPRDIRLRRGCKEPTDV